MGASAISPVEFHRALRRLESLANVGARTAYDSESDLTRWFVGGQHVGTSNGPLGTGSGYTLSLEARAALAPREHRTISTRGVGDAVLRYKLIVAWARHRYTNPATGWLMTCTGGPARRGGQPSRYAIVEELAATKLLGVSAQFDCALVWTNSPGRYGGGSMERRPAGLTQRRQ